MVCCLLQQKDLTWSDLIWVANWLQGQIQKFFIGGGRGRGGGVQTLVQEGLFFSWPAEKAETTTCFSICERQSPLVQELLLCKQRRADHRRVPKNNKLHFWISLEFSLVAKCNTRFINKNQRVKKWYNYDPAIVTISVSNKCQVCWREGGVQTPRTLPLDPPLVYSHVQREFSM